MFLVDTNVWLEALLSQAKAREALAFLRGTEAHLLAITDFSLHSIGVIAARNRNFTMFANFIADTIVDSAVKIVALDNHDLLRALMACESFNLDFDDAYQYAAAEKYDMTLVSFDSDLDRTPRGRKTPAQVLADLAK